MINVLNSWLSINWNDERFVPRERERDIENWHFVHPHIWAWRYVWRRGSVAGWSAVNVAFLRDTSLNRSDRHVFRIEELIPRAESYHNGDIHQSNGRREQLNDELRHEQLSMREHKRMEWSCRRWSDGWSSRLFHPNNECWSVEGTDPIDPDGKNSC